MFSTDIHVPLFRTQSGKTFDGLPRAAGAEKGKRRRVVAKNGYVVGGLKATSENAIRSMTVIFHKLTDEGTDPEDSYESDTYGKWEGGNKAVITIDGKVPVGGVWLLRSRARSTRADCD